MGPSTWLTISQLAILVGLIVVALGGYGTYYFNKKLAQERENRHAIVGTLDPTDTAVSGKSIEHARPVIEFGDSGSMLVWNGPAGTPMIQFWEDISLTIERVNNHVVVSTMIHDSSGKLVAELVKNEWRVNPGGAWDRNYTNDTLEVRGVSGEVVLQVRTLPTRIQFQAKMYNAAGRGMYWGKIVGPDGKVGGGWEFTGKNHPELTYKISPLFRYPSDLHFGEYAGRDTQTTDSD